MKTTNLKWIAYALSALMLMQSCKVYHSKTLTLEEAIMTQKRVKVKTYNGHTYKFNYLFRENDQLFGTAERYSSAAEKLSKQMVTGYLFGEFVKYPLKESTIKEYHLQNKTLSRILPIVIPIALLGIILGVWWLTDDDKTLVGVY